MEEIKIRKHQLLSLIRENGTNNPNLKEIIWNKIKIMYKPENIQTDECEDECKNTIFLIIV